MGLATLARPPMILGWACLILLLAKPGGALTGRLAAAGGWPSPIISRPA